MTTTTTETTMEPGEQEIWGIWMRYSPADLKAMIAHETKRVEAGEEWRNGSVLQMKKALEIQTTR